VEHGLKIRYARRRRKNVLKPEEIEKRELVFDPREMEQLVMLEKLLQDKKLNETQKRLAQKNMPKGITVLLYGQPGTGKTESALQMCKSTGRELMKLDISQTKSMWFGQSEKIIKQVFTDYKEFAKESKRTPVLLFNEADAILSKRKDTNSSSTAQTENAIQNVLLEELENFEGILIATTNLHKNFDKAFERRFLFKIAFGKPGLDARKKIWRLKMPGLPATDYSALAKQFNFTGGQIDNIVRKYEIFKIVQNKKANLKQLERFCREELLDGEIKKMGF
jgi:SpoVK/Ycf46/Vps4 family AAA+-type ATPase